jgi:hypothetical protein
LPWPDRLERGEPQPSRGTGLDKARERHPAQTMPFVEAWVTSYMRVLSPSF